jgi:ABC-type multidrug transport system ATPase subunit
VISLRSVTRTYGAVAALRDVSVAFDAGEGVVALLGRNGAGKSTLLSILSGLSAQTGGELVLNGVVQGADRRALRRVSTLLPQHLHAPQDVSARAFVHYLLRLRRMRASAADAWFHRFDLDRIAHAPLKTLSGGERQRVGLVYAFAADTPLLLLDEPTQGLDPWERLRFADHVAEVSARRLVVCATHIVSDVEATASRVIVVHDGGIAYDGTVEELRGTAPRVHVWRGDEAAAAAWRERGALTAIARIGADRYRMRLVTDQPPHGAEPVEPTLTDAYLSLTPPQPHVGGRPRRVDASAARAAAA